MAGNKQPEKKKTGPKGPHKDPELRKKAIALRLPTWLCDWLQTQDNQSVTVEKALTKVHKLKAPKPAAVVK